MSDDDEKQRTRPTEVPSVGPTVAPPFDLETFARDSGIRSLPLLFSDTVLEVVSDCSWSGAKLDILEIELLRCIDGVSPVTLLESMVAVPRDELQAMIATLLARGLVRVVDGFDAHAPVSGLRPGRAGPVDSLVVAARAQTLCRGTEAQPSCAEPGSQKAMRTRPRRRA